MTTAPEVYSQLRSTYFRPALKDLGFAVTSKTRWLRGSPEAGWIVVEVLGDRYNTADEGEWTALVRAWPTGTWEWARGLQGLSGDRPHTAWPPVHASRERVFGPDAPRRDLVTLRRDMPEPAIAEAANMLLDTMATSIAWLEGLLRSDSADDHMPARFALGALETTKRWTPGRRQLLDLLTVECQRGQWGRGVHSDMTAAWRDAAGLPPVPLPAWHHGLMHSAPTGRSSFELFDSPQAAFDAGSGSGTQVRLADGTFRPPAREDFPDARRIRSWRRRLLLRRARALPTVPVSPLPDWLPWHEWVLRAR